MRIEIVQSTGEQPWHARFVSGNGEKVAWTENYHNRSDAIFAVARLAEVFGVKGRFNVQGPPGNAMLVFSHSSFGSSAPAETRFVIHDVDER